MRSTLILMLLLALACGGHEEKTAANSAPAPAVANNANLTPEQLGELGAQMQRNPDQAQELLAHHGLTPESFEKAIRDITENPEASKRYAAAYRRAGA